MQKGDTLMEQSVALENGSVSAYSLAKHSIKFASDYSRLNAFVSLDEEYILKQAKAADERRSNDSVLSKIDGLCIAVKDNYLTEFYPTTACSDARPLEPTGVNATVIENLKKAGAIIFAKTNMHEWAFGATNTTSNIGVTNNPHNLSHITGGSSGGSAAAVAAGIVPAALGSDTGGSVRIPASACGIYGFKPSYGRASRFGVLPLSWSLDAPGPMANSIEDIELLLPYFFGADKLDKSTLNAKRYQPYNFVGEPKLVNLVGEGLERSSEVDSCILDLLELFSADVCEKNIPQISSFFAAWETILHCEASSYHSKLLSTHANNFSEVTRAHLEAGKDLTAVELLKAQKIRNQFITLMDQKLGDADCLILPTLPVTAPLHGVDWQVFENRRVTTQDSMTWFCWLGNLAGIPCLTMPIGSDRNGLPIGIMLMGRFGEDEKLIAVAKHLDKFAKKVRK